MTPQTSVSPLSALRKDGIPLTASIRGTRSRCIVTSVRSIPAYMLHASARVAPYGTN